MQSRSVTVVLSIALLGAGVAVVARQAIPRGADVAKSLPAPTPEKAGTRFAKVVGWPEGGRNALTARPRQHLLSQRRQPQLHRAEGR